MNNNNINKILYNILGGNTPGVKLRDYNRCHLVTHSAHKKINTSIEKYSASKFSMPSMKGVKK